MSWPDNEIVRFWKIPNNVIENTRADFCLTYFLKTISRNKIQIMIRRGYFKISGSLLKSSQCLKPGDIVEITKPDLRSDYIKKIEEIKIPIIFENDNLLILNKPPNLLIHPTAEYTYGTLTNWLKKKYPNQNIKPCHRLDKETTGILICAKNHDTEIKIRNDFFLAKIKKSYLALVTGCMLNTISCVRSLRLQGKQGLVSIKMIEDSINGLKSETKFIPIKYYKEKNQTLILCKPKTGRQHQIRAHLALEGHPVVGDKLYSMGELFFDLFTKEKLNLSSAVNCYHMLHAYEIEFWLNGKEYKFKAESSLIEDVKDNVFLNSVLL